MRRLCIVVFGLLLIALMPVVAHDVCEDGELIVNGACGAASVADLDAGWTMIEPGGETMCAHGTPYAYWVHPGARNDLLVFFQGGGGCWDADTCRDTGSEWNGFYDSRVSRRDSPANRGGLLDLDHPENPFTDYTVLYIPVCTGDVHMGDLQATFDDVTVNYNGFVNAATALEWAYENVPDPDSVYVTGCSAGSPGSIMHTPYIIEQYPQAQVAQMGDSLSLIITGTTNLVELWGMDDVLPDWIPAFAELSSGMYTMAQHYVAVANHYPDYTFSQFNTVRDRVQVFYTLNDRNADGDLWTPLLDKHLQTIHDNAENYRSFTSGGDLHCVTPGGAFYRYAIDGVRLRDWVADMAAGKAVETLRCADCTRAETVD